jgi:hypothetical protein
MGYTVSLAGTPAASKPRVAVPAATWTRFFRTCRISVLLFQAAGFGIAAGPVYVRETGSSLALGNDFLERTISIADGQVGTVRFLNKISGQAYALGGSEFEMKLIYERVGYDFGGENPRVLTARGLRVADRKVEDLAGGGKRLVLHLATPAPAGGGRGRGGRGTQVDVVYELKPDDFFMRQWVVLPKPQQGTLFLDWVSVAKNEWGLPKFSLGGFGQPLVADDIFLGVEYPTAINQARGSEADLGGYIGVNIPAEGYTSEPAVFGVAPAGMVHQQFLAYVDRMRVTPVRPYALYNTWYDLQRAEINHDGLRARIPVLNNLLFQKYGIHMDSFVIDDGWDDMTKLWVIDEKRFPDGFRDLADSLKGVTSGLGLWFGPIGGYGQKQVRLAAGKREGMEITSDGQNLCIAGKNYSRLLSDTMARYQKDFSVNYFKIDGTPFGCNAPDHGHPVGIYSREADARALIDILKRLRGQDQKVFLNITTSLWLSPWWLRYADTVWMGGADSGYLPSVPTLAQRQSAVSYRDSVLYHDFVAHQAQFPISSLMTHGIIKGKRNMLGGKNEFLDDWKDEVVHYYSVGNMMYELYISPDILSPEEIDSLGNATRWAEANAHPLLDNSTMVLGDPAQREPYGYVHSSAERSIVTLRNPFVAPKTVKLKIDEQQGFLKTDRPEVLEIQYPYRKMQAGTVHFGETLTFQLGSYEEILFELRPAADDQLRIEGTRYTAEKTADGATALRLYAPAGSTQTVRVVGNGASRIAVDGAEVPAQSRPGNTLTLHFGAPAPQGELAYSPASMRVEGVAGEERTVHVTASIQVPADYPEAKLAFLIEPEQDLRGVKGDALDNGKPLELTLENGGRGVWHWFWANLAPGKHSLDLTFHVPASPGDAHVSGWLLTKRALIAKRLEVAFPAGRAARVPETNLLPASSNVERNTYALMEESIR